MNYSNNAQSTLKTGISASSTSVILADGTGDLFPAGDFFATLEKYDSNNRVIKREIVKCTARVGDICTIQRSQDPCPQSWDATAQTSVAMSFESGDVFTHNATAKTYETMDTNIAGKLAKVGEKRTGLIPSSVLITDSSGNETESTTLPDAVMNSIATSPIIMNTVGNAGKYIQTVALGEAVSSATPVAMAVIMNDKRMTFSTSGLASGVSYKMNGVGEIVTVVWSHNITSGWDTTNLFGSNDNTTWTNIGSLYYHDSNQTSGTFTPPTGSIYRYLKIERAGRTFSLTINTNQQGVGQIMMINTLGSDIAGSRVKSGIVIRPNVTDALGRVYTSQNATSSSARVQLYQGATLVAEKTPTISTDYVDFTESVTKDTDYIICLNDSSYFNAQNNELALASYQANNPYCVSGYLNGDTNVNPQNIRRIDFGTKKAMKATANSTAEYANFAGFISDTKVLGDSVDLNANDGGVVSGFSGLTAGKEIYLSNTAGVISTTQGTIPSRIGSSVSSNQIVLDSQRTIIKRGTTLGSISITKSTAGNIYSNPVFFHGGLISWTFTSNYAHTTASSTLEFSVDLQNWTTLTTLTHSASGTLTETSGGMYQKGYFRCGCNPGGAFTLTTSLTITT